MEWESKFGSIIRETEANLARVKEHLGTASSPSLTSLTASTRSYTSPSPPKHAYHSMSASLPWQQSPTKSVSFQEPLLSSTRREVTNHGENFHIDQSPAVALLLKDKVDDQQRTIDNLSRTVKKLEEEKIHYQFQIKNIQDELSTLGNRVAERGVDLQTERKIEQWKREMYSEMKSLHSQLEMYRSSEDGTRYTDSQLSSLTRDVHQMKTYLREECESMRRELEGIKTRTVKLELELGSTAADGKDISRRHDRLDRTVREMCEAQLSQSRELNRSRGERDHSISQISELRTSLRTLRNKIDSLETRKTITDSFIFTNSANHEEIPNKRNREKKKSKGKMSAKILITPTDSTFSDLDLSIETSLDDYNSDDLEVPDKLTRKSEKHNGYADDLEDQLDDLDLSDVDTASSDALDFDEL